MKSLLLNTATWDLALDANRNLAVTPAPYAMAQDVANACRLFKGELFYNTAPGIPYFDEALGHWPPLALMRARLTEAALGVPGVVKVKVVLNSLVGRELKGEVRFTDSTGQENNVTL